MDVEVISHAMFEVLIHHNAIAISNAVYLLNGCKVQNGYILESKLPRGYTSSVQAVEYLRSHLFNRTGWNVFGGAMCYSGTATIFNRQAVLDVGGLSVPNFSWDCDIIMSLHRLMHDKKKPYTIGFFPSVAVWTDVPSDLKEFARQRDKWNRGILFSTVNNLKMMLNPKYKLQGLFSFPIYFLLEIVAHYVEFTAYFTVGLAYCFGVLDVISLSLYIILAWGFASYISVSNAFISYITFNRYYDINSGLRMLLLTVLETFGFRQYRVLINVYGTFHYIVNRLRGKSL